MSRANKLLTDASDRIGAWKRISDNIGWLIALPSSTGLLGWVTSLIPALKDLTLPEYALLGFGLTLLALTVLSFAANSYVRFSQFRSPPPEPAPAPRTSVDVIHLENGMKWLEETVSDLIENKVPKIETEVANLRPAAMLAKLEFVEARLDHIIAKAERRKDSFLEAAKGLTNRNELADYRMNVYQELGEGKKLVDSLTDPGEVDIVPPQEFFKTPAADANPHSVFPGMEEFPNNEIRHECRKMLEVYEKTMSLMKEAKNGFAAKKAGLKEQLARIS